MSSLLSKISRSKHGKKGEREFSVLREESIEVPMPVMKGVISLVQIADSAEEKRAKRVVRNIIHGNESVRLQRPGLESNHEPSWLSIDSRRVSGISELYRFVRAEIEQLLSEQYAQQDLVQSLRTIAHSGIDAARKEIRITRKLRETFERELITLVQGYGPLNELFEDELVTDIFVDDYRTVRVIRRGQLLQTPISFPSPLEYKLFLKGLLTGAEQELNDSNPIVDCILKDSWRSRVSVLHPSVLDGVEPRIAFRIPRLKKIGLFDVLQTKTLPASLAAWLGELVMLRAANILVVGPHGSGKTTMAGALLAAVGTEERVVTIEELPELFVPTIQMEKIILRSSQTRAGEGIHPDGLLQAALRRAPHRLVLGELRDDVALPFLRLLEAGYQGSLATIHAENAGDALWRFVDMCLSSRDVHIEAMMRRLARSIHIVVTMGLVDGQPCLLELSEVVGVNEKEFKLDPIVRFSGVQEKKRVWELVAKASRWMNTLAKQDIQLKLGGTLRAGTELRSES